MKTLLFSLLALWSGVLLAENIQYKVEGEAFESFYVTPAKNAPLVLLIHDWDGVTEYEEMRAKMLAEQGYAVVALDLYGAGIRPEAIADRRQQTAKLYRDRQRMRDLVNAGIAEAKQLGANTDNAVLIGYCFGGTAVLEMARSGLNTKGFVAIHGGLGTPEDQDYQNVQAEILVQHGAADANISMADFAALNMALERDEVPNEMTAYGGAGHSFSKAGNRLYNAEADAKSWQRLLKFLDKKLR